MATEILLARKNGRLVPVDDLADEFIRNMGEGEVITAHVRRPRNLKHHRMFWALIQLIFERQNKYATARDLATAIKMSLGFFEEIRSIRTDKVIYIPKSIAFDSMDQEEFSQYFERAVALICEYIVPALDNGGLIDEVNAILSGNRNWRSPALIETTNQLRIENNANRKT